MEGNKMRQAATINSTLAIENKTPHLPNKSLKKRTHRGTLSEEDAARLQLFKKVPELERLHKRKEIRIPFIGRTDMTFCIYPGKHKEDIPIIAYDALNNAEKVSNIIEKEGYLSFRIIL